MHRHEVHEQIEKAHSNQQKGIGLTTAVVAVLLAIATMLGNNANTRKVVLETKIADWWAYAHSNETNARVYMANERVAQLHGEREAAEEFHKFYEEQNRQSGNARLMAQKLEKDSDLETRKAHYFEGSQLFLELSIVLGSIALLTELLLFWRVSFLSTALGIALIVIGVSLH